MSHARRVLIAALFNAAGLMAMGASGAEVGPSPWGPDTVGREELSGTQDPTFDSVSRHFPMLQLPREALGVPEGRDEFVLLPDASIEISNASSHVSPENRVTVHFLLGADKQRFGQGIAPDAKRLHEGYLPLVSAPFVHDGLRYEQTVFAWSENMAPDPGARLWAYVELAVRNPGDQPRAAEIACQADCGLPPVQVAAGAWALEVPAHGAKSLFLKIPYDGTLPRDGAPEPGKRRKPSRYAQLPFAGGFRGIEAVAQAEYRKRFEEAAAAWRRICNQGLQIRVPEQRVNDAYRALTKPEFCHGFGFGYWLTALRRDEPKRAILGFYSTMAFGMTRSTHGGVEHPYVTGQNPHTIPHLRTGSQQLRLLRTILVREEGETLILAQATPRTWLEHGQSVSVQDAPSDFGPLGYRIDSLAGEGRILVRIDPPARRAPAAILLWVRHPEGKPIRAVRVDGQASDRFRGERLTLAASGRAIHVEVNYDSSGHHERP